MFGWVHDCVCVCVCACVRVCVCTCCVLCCLTTHTRRPKCITQTAKRVRSGWVHDWGVGKCDWGRSRISWHLSILTSTACDDKLSHPVCVGTVDSGVILWHHCSACVLTSSSAGITHHWQGYPLVNFTLCASCNVRLYTISMFGSISLFGCTMFRHSPLGAGYPSG